MKLRSHLLKLDKKKVNEMLKNQVQQLEKGQELLQKKHWLIYIKKVH